MRIRIKEQPSGLINGREWPAVGDECDVPDVVGADACAGGWAEPVAAKPKVEKRPAAKRTETRKA